MSRKVEADAAELRAFHDGTILPVSTICFTDGDGQTQDSTGRALLALIPGNGVAVMLLPGTKEQFAWKNISPRRDDGYICPS